MFQAYSKRMLSPFIGQVQIVDSGPVRGLSLDGSNWEVQYRLEVNEQPPASPYQQPGAPKQSYIRVAMIRPSGIQRVPLPPRVDADSVSEHIDTLAQHVEELSVPLPPADVHEYWLLDEMDEQPLALIFSCVTAEEMATFPQRTEWAATPASIMKVASIPEEEQHYTPPVNYRLEQLVNERAGSKPKARWIKRREGLTETFPALLVREDWEKEEAQRIYQRYIERQAPRLLMLHGLDSEERRRLEGYARQNALEVDRFFHLYPDVADEKTMSAIRVEARLRRAADDTLR